MKILTKIYSFGFLVVAMTLFTAAHADTFDTEKGVTFDVPPTDSTSQVNVRFISNFLTKVSNDESFRDLCVEDLPTCLDEAKLSVPLGLKMSYAFDKDMHSVTYNGLTGGETVVTIDSEGTFDVQSTGGMKSRGNLSAAWEWFVYKCYGGSPGDFGEHCFSMGNPSYCSCASHFNSGKYPCYLHGAMNFYLACDSYSQ